MPRIQLFMLASWLINVCVVIINVIIIIIFNTLGRLPASVAQWAEAQCAPTGTICRRGGVQSPGRPVDFVFGFQGRML